MYLIYEDLRIVYLHMALLLLDTCRISQFPFNDLHLAFSDCIGSAFNASGSMQCPNCRKVEIGLWRRFENNSPEESIDEDDNDEDVDDFTELVKTRALVIYIYCYSVQSTFICIHWGTLEMSFSGPNYVILTSRGLFGLCESFDLVACKRMHF